MATTATPNLQLIGSLAPVTVLPKSISYHNFGNDSPNPLTSSATSSPVAIIIGDEFRGSNNTFCEEEDEEEEYLSSEESIKVLVSDLDEDEILSQYHQKHLLRQQQQKQHQLQVLAQTRAGKAKEDLHSKELVIATADYSNESKKSLTFFSSNKSKPKLTIPTSKTIAHSIGLASEEEDAEFDDVYDENLDKKKTGSNRRGLPLNASFSSWLQLFLSKKRSNHHRGGVIGPNGQRSGMRSSVSLSVVHESSTLGSDGESLEVSPCTSDQMSTSSFYPCSSNNMYAADGDRMASYVPNVKMRQKPNNRRWSEKDIQKRLSLPADIKLPQTVVDKLNRTPTLDNPLTRKSRRASLSEIGFGKLETYKKIFDLGEGTYATVYLGKSLLTGKSVALKEIRLEHEEGAPCTAIREVSLLRNLKHANVVTLHDIIYTERVLTLVFEFVEHDLREYMEEIESMICMNNVKLFLVQLLRGLAYCHKRRILHRDLKPQNLLINRAGELKLADFGLARAQSVPTKTYSNEVVTLWYRPPDVLLGSIDYSTHIDMWGVGCILYEMLEHRPLFPGSTTDEQLNLIFQRLGTPSPEIYPHLCALPLYKSAGYKPYSAKSLLNSDRINQERADLLLRMLKYDGRSRIQAADALSHPMLASTFHPESVLALPDTESVLSLPGVSYTPEQPGVRKPAK